MNAILVAAVLGNFVITERLDSKPADECFPITECRETEMAFVITERLPTVTSDVLLRPAVPDEPPEVLTRIPRPYPLRNTYWTVSGVAAQNCPAQTVANHLLSGQHRGQFSAADIAGRSWAELHSMHSDHHEGRLKLTAAQPSAPSQPVRAASAVSCSPAYVRRSCPGGVCPTQYSTRRQGVFARLFR